MAPKPPSSAAGDGCTMPDGSKPGGLFTLIFRKIQGAWKIVHDHTSAEVPSKTESSPTADQPVARRDANSVLAHQQMLENMQKGHIDVYFTGNSITRRWRATDYPQFLANWNKNFLGWNAANFGWGGDTIQNILWRLQNGELDGVDPRVIVLLAGTNDLGRVPASDNEVAEITRGIKALLDTMRQKAPGATIILMGILPRNDRVWPTAVIPSINAINENIARLADGKTIRYLNINDKLADRDGRLFEGMTVDRLHLSLKGYQIWADALRPLLMELLGPPAREDHAAAANRRSESYREEGLREESGTPGSDEMTSPSGGCHSPGGNAAILVAAVSGRGLSRPPPVTTRRPDISATAGAISFSGISPTTSQRFVRGSYSKYVAHDVSRRLRAVAAPARDQDPAIMDDCARFKMAPSIREACNRDSISWFWNQSNGKSSRQLALYHAHAGPPERRSAFDGSGSQMASRIGQVWFCAASFSRLRSRDSNDHQHSCCDQPGGRRSNVIDARPPPGHPLLAVPAGAGRVPTCRTRSRTSTLRRWPVRGVSP